MQPAIEFKNVTKRYRIGRGFTSLRSALSGKQNSKADYHWAVNDVSFELKPGEALGIIGPNGAGKTTILKLLSLVTRPTSGEILINGRLSALIELGAGFHPDLTGRENVFLNGTILGMSREEIKKRFDDIVEFSGIGQYLDTPVKRYSSGMYARLGFSIAAHVDPEILLVDEVLAVGDYAFRMKCYDRMDELRHKGTSLIFISHNMEDIRRVCDRGLVMYLGKKVFEGSADLAVAEYANVLRLNASKADKPTVLDGSGLSQRKMTHGAKVVNVEMVGQDGKPVKTVASGETVDINVEVEFYEDAESPVFATSIRSSKSEMVYDITTRLQGVDTPSFKAGDRTIVTYRMKMNLLSGIYHLATDLAYADLSCYYDYVASAMSFVVTGADQAKGVANLDAEVIFDNHTTTLPHPSLESPSVER